MLIEAVDLCTGDIIFDGHNKPHTVVACLGNMDEDIPNSIVYAVRTDGNVFDEYFYRYERIYVERVNVSS